MAQGGGYNDEIECFRDFSRLLLIPFGHRQSHPVSAIVDLCDSMTEIDSRRRNNASNFIDYPLIANFIRGVGDANSAKVVPVDQVTKRLLNLFCFVGGGEAFDIY